MTFKPFQTLLLLCLLGIFTSTALAADIKLNKQGFQFSYPESWKMSEKTLPEKGIHLIQLISSTNPQVRLSMNLTKSNQGAGIKPSQAGDVGQAFCLPIVLKIADKKNEKVTHMYTQIQVSGKSSPAVIMSVQHKEPNTGNHSNLHCFSLYNDKQLAVGAIHTAGIRGQIIQKDEYKQAVQQAYSIVNSLSIEH